MEEDDDDFYGGGGSHAQDGEFLIKAEDEEREDKMDVNDDQDEEEEDSDDVRVSMRQAAGTYINKDYIGCSIHFREARRRPIGEHVG